MEELQPEVPQPEEIPADVHEQTTDPANLVIASVISSIQTSTIPPHGNIFLFTTDAPIFHFINHFCQSFSWHSFIGNLSRSARGSIGVVQSEARDGPEASKLPNLYLYCLSMLDHRITYFIFLFRNMTLLTACSPSPSTSLRMKARRQVLLEQLESHQQKSGKS